MVETAETALGGLGGAGAALLLLGGLAKDRTHSRSTAESPLLRLALLLSATGHCACAGVALVTLVRTLILGSPLRGTWALSEIHIIDLSYGLGLTTLTLQTWSLIIHSASHCSGCNTPAGGASAKATHMVQNASAVACLCHEVAWPPFLEVL